LIKKILPAVLALSLISFPAYSKEATFQKRIEKEILCPKSFLSNPPVYFYCIYRDYHNNKFDNGIEKAKRALKEIESLMRKNPNGTVPNAVQKNAKLRDPHVKSVASDLHMLLGMLYYKKSLNLDDSSVKKIYADFYKNLEKKGFNFFQIEELMNLYTKKKLFPDSLSQKDTKKYKELLSKMEVKEGDLDRLISKAQRESDRLDQERLTYLQKAVKELQEAVKVDPENGLAYYQLGNLYSGSLGEDLPEASSAAEEAYYKAALIFKRKGDKEAYKEVIKKLELANPNSPYLKRLKDNHA